MKKLSILFLFLTLAFASCQTKYPDLEKGLYAEIITNKGTFVAKLYNEATPLTVANFVELSEGKHSMVDSAFKGKKFYDGITFHRVMKDFMIQGGDPKGDGTGNPGFRFPDEFVDTLVHDRKGILSMANGGPGTNGSQFFITLKETPWLDGRHTVFGEIVMGQEVVDTIGSVPVEQPSNKPIEPVTIETVNIINKGSIALPSFASEMEEIERVKKEKEEAYTKISTATAVELTTLKQQAEELPSGVKVFFNQKGKGQKPTMGSRILMNYTGYFTNGNLFTTNVEATDVKYGTFTEQKKAQGQYNPAESDYSPDARLIPGFREALLMMSVGDKTTVYIPSHLGYGERGSPPVIPANADLVFELELVGLVGQN